ncbi:hypothetical protein L873DRAFT_1814548 [Choiromyces venosus 120613-1]|uniref:Uncharacterized protein n=1 Tax=Choiromyces venosus 120613-1 TaxID=1336337 RepID=A0A3N4JCS4_9PEZI|nr:hypothetical protein L873DRAFT_1824092 [Choiromyces venosus 120613-1]RPA94240.1 hypothetical protein L873DRAFT_1814724 [Choiromyces venosus 120613-1]RPA94375.1 hypothetical protein L873DRAFT_1814548 [Choiromyces venosus 120613-1]
MVQEYLSIKPAPTAPNPPPRRISAYSLPSVHICISFPYLPYHTTRSQTYLTDDHQQFRLSIPCTQTKSRGRNGKNTEKGIKSI